MSIVKPVSSIGTMTTCTYGHIGCEARQPVQVGTGAPCNLPLITIHYCEDKLFNDDISSSEYEHTSSIGGKSSGQ
jgi:hypothetical protein